MLDLCKHLPACQNNPAVPLTVGPFKALHPVQLGSWLGHIVKHLPVVRNSPVVQHTHTQLSAIVAFDACQIGVLSCCKLWSHYPEHAHLRQYGCISLGSFRS